MTGNKSGRPYSKGESGYCQTIRIEELVMAAQSGCASSFAEIREMYWRRLFRTVISITRSPEDAEDALQDTFLRAFIALKSFQWRSTFYTWLTQIAINSALMLLRRKRRHLEIPLSVRAEGSSKRSQSIELDVEDPSPGPEEICSRRQIHLLLIGAVGRLDPKFRAVLEIRLRRGCSPREIGRSLNISEAAVKSRLCRARRRLTQARILWSRRVDDPGGSKVSASALEVM